MSSGTPTTEQDHHRVRKLREAGLSVRVIAKEQRLSPMTVQRILKSAVDK